MGYVDRGLAGVIRGQLVICLVNGFLTWIGLKILGVPYSTLLAFVAGVFSLIPVFGTIASSIPIVLVALTAGGVHAAVMALAWICLIHLLEANIFNPLIMGTSAEMHPVVIIFALLAGEHAFGVWGALLAVPTASLIQSCFKYYRHEVLGIPPAEPHGHGAWMRKLLARRAAPPASAPVTAVTEKGGAG
jgi:predicted PurR-regulated permease PerM